VTRRVETAPTFERDLKRLGRRYRNIRRDVEPLIEELITGELPGDRVMGVRSITKSGCRTATPAAARAAAIA
jgi:hypothetical protein